jgi:hypothetical protein
MMKSCPYLISIRPAIAFIEDNLVEGIVESGFV